MTGKLGNRLYFSTLTQPPYPMPNSLPSFLKPEQFKDGIFYLSSPEEFRRFESDYIALREKENRLYEDQTIATLPITKPNHPYHQEWTMRLAVHFSLLDYLGRKHFEKPILEIGCGNGWLSSQIGKKSKGLVVGLDVNRIELETASRVFGTNPLLHFVFADIFSNPFPKSTFNVIVLSGAIQYFNNIHQLFEALKPILKPDGEVHILDSPFYEEGQQLAARERSRQYFTKLGLPRMTQSFHHHTWNQLNDYAYKVLHHPKSLKSRFLRKLGKPINPFPWIRIT